MRMSILNASFPRIQNRRKASCLTILAGVLTSVFILWFKPFGIQNETGEWYVDLVIAGFGGVFIGSILTMEGLIPYLFPSLFENWTFGKAILWYSALILFLGLNNYLYKSYWEGFEYMSWSGFSVVFGRTLAIVPVISFFVLGFIQSMSQKKIALLSHQENVRIKTTGGKSIQLKASEVLYIESDDNYVDIHLESEGIRRKVILRSSLKNVEAQLVNPFSPIFRCHRRYLINLKRVYILDNKSRSLSLSLKKYSDKIPVSRSYVNKVRSKLAIRP